MSDTSSADVVNKAITEDAVPAMTPQNPTIVPLMRGIRETKDDEVVWHTIATVRELTGEDEEVLATLTQKDLLYTEYMSAVLARAVESIGELQGITEAHLNKLIIQDRELLFLGILRVTYGDTRELHTVCRECGTANTITIELNEDFPIKEPDFDVREGFIVTSRGREFRLRLPNGEDTIFAQKHGKTDAEYNTAMLSRCVVHDDHLTPDESLIWAKKLGTSYRKKLVNTLLELEIGPTLEGVDTHCAECKVEMTLLLDWVSLLLG